MRHRALVPSLVVVAALAIAGCGGDDDDDAATTTTAETTTTTAETTTTTAETTTTTAAPTTTTASGEPRLTELNGPTDVTCGAGSASVTAEITYATSGADTISYTVDGQAPGAQAGFGPSGTIGAELPCDGGSHVVAVTPIGNGSEGPTESLTINVSGS
jgi:hypothetical protein